MGWFSSKTDGMPDLGQGRGWRASDFKRRERVPVSKLISTNKGGYLDESRVAKYAERGGGDIYVVKHRGKYYVADGHHSAAAAAARGEKNVRVRVVEVK